MNKLLLLLPLATMAASAQSGLIPPQLGFISASDHSMRPVLGLPGNLLLGSPAATNVDFVEWSGTLGLVKTGSALIAFDGARVLGSLNTAPEPALFAFRADGFSALVLLVQSGALYAWTGKEFEPLAYRAQSLGGNPLAIGAPPSGGVDVIVQRDDGLWQLGISAQGDVQSQSALPGIQPPVLLQNDGALFYSTKTTLVVRPGKGRERSIALGIAIGEMHWMGRGCIRSGRRLQAASSQFESRGSEKITQLPEPR